MGNQTVDCIIDRLKDDSHLSLKWKDLDDKKLLMMSHRLSQFQLPELVDRKEALKSFSWYLANPTNVKGPALFTVHAGPSGGKTKFFQELCDRKRR